MLNLGDVPASSVLPILFDTFAVAGESITMSGLAVTDIEIYGGTSMTQRASDNGYTLLDTDGIDLDGITGIQGFSVDLSDNSDVGFYAVGTRYRVVVSTITVDSKTVSFTAAVFRIVAAESIAGKPKVDVDAFGGTAGTFASGRPEVNATHLAGTAYASADFSATMKASINTEADTALTDYGALKPTTAGRTLTVSAAGTANADVVAVDGSGLAAHAIGMLPVDVRDWAGLGATLAVDAENFYPAVATLHLDSTAYSDVRGAIGMAAANMDTQLGTKATQTSLDGLITTVGVAGLGLSAIPKTGYKLASDGLDSVATTAPTGVASNYREMVVQLWRRFFKKTVYDITSNNIKTYADNGTTVVTTQTTAVSATEETQGAAS